MRNLIPLLALFLALPTCARAQTTFNGSTNVTVIGNFIAHSITATQEFTLANGETLDNASDGIVRFTGNDTGPTLLQLKLETETGTSISAADSHIISAIADNDVGTPTEFGRIDFDFSDISPAENSIMRLQVLDAGSLTTKFSIDSAGILLENGERIENDTNSDLDFTFDDNNPLLGEVRIRTAVTQDLVADDDYYYLHFAAPDSAGNETEFASVRGNILNRLTTAEMGSLAIYTTVSGTPTLRATFDSVGLTVPLAVTSTTFGVSGNATFAGNIVGDTATVVTNVNDVYASDLLSGQDLVDVDTGNSVAMSDVHTKVTVTQIGGFAADQEKYIFIAPYACTIQRVMLASDTTTVDIGDGTNNIDFQVENVTQTETLQSTVKTTETTDITANTAYTLSVDQNLTLSQSDILELQINEDGAATDLSTAEIIVTVEYR